MEEFIFDLTEIPSSDILVNADLTKKDIFEIQNELTEKLTLTFHPSLNHIIKIAVQNKRISDIDSLCIAYQGLHWEYKGKKVVSPLILIPITQKINKVSQTIQIEIDFENFFFNPFIINELKRNYSLTWTVDENLNWADNCVSFHRFLQQNDFTKEVTNFQIIGNFHHHRYAIVKDLEALKNAPQNRLVQEILGNDFEKTNETKTLTNFNIVSIDKDQQTVFEKIKSGNLVIQGPPGTGKSQVLTNLLAKLLFEGKMNLVVSEKKAALEVLVKKLTQFELDDFTFIAQSQIKPHDFLLKLKKTWDKLELDREQPPTNLLLSEQLLSHFQLTLDKMLSKNLIGGVSLEEFKSLLKSYDLEGVGYSSKVPSIKIWLEQKEQIEKLFETWSGFGKIKLLNQKALTSGLELDIEISKLKLQFEQFSTQFNIATVAELVYLIKQIPRFQILENESYKKYAPLFSSKKEQRKFEKLKSTWISKQGEFNLMQIEEKNWIEIPSYSLLESWKMQLSGNWWNKRKAEKSIQKQLKNKEILVSIAIENWTKYQLLAQELQVLRSQFQAIGIERPDLEIDSISYIVKQLESEKINEIKEAISVDQNIRKQLISSALDLEKFHSNLKNLINYDLEKLVLKDFVELEINIQDIILQKKHLINFNPIIYNLIQTEDSPQQIGQKILKNHWVNFESQWPELAKFDGEKMLSIIEKIIKTESIEMLLFGKQIYFQQATNFQKLNALLRTPNGKLKTEEKAFKATIKIGKAILVKEFSKTKQHKTIRELLDSEARAWIEILTPIWLSTPTQVATTFPMEKSLFNAVIFDEASQIPLSNALGSLQRADRAIVAGDEHQMSPGNYFSGAVSSVDLLHQANYYYPKVNLKHHYRSNHPTLIAFSNRYFYQNELIAYPSANATENPLNLHFVENGLFIDRQNLEEAKCTAILIEKLIDQKDSLGIVAFSEQQLDCIWKQLSVSTQHKLQQNSEQNLGFFRALEQVQGDECDILIISLGYGRNEAGDFHKRFGPLNQKNGSKRLNVLLTRAKKSIHFFTSIKSNYLEVSTNESVNLLRFFLLQLEKNASSSNLVFPFELNTNVEDGNNLLIDKVTNQIQDARELITLHDVLSKRGWKISYQF